MLDSTVEDPPFRFLDLPNELRRRILWYTDLVIPNNVVDGLEDLEIHFNYTSEKFYVKRYQIQEWEGSRIVDENEDPNEENEDESDENGENSAENAHEDEENDYKGGNETSIEENEDEVEIGDEGESNVDCDDETYGPRLHLPTALFRVSKLVKDEALDVLFFYNRLSLCCTFQKNLEWLRRIPQVLLKRVRKLDLVIHRRDLPFKEYEKEEETTEADSGDLLDFIGASFNLERLFLSLVRRWEIGTPMVLCDRSYALRPKQLFLAFCSKVKKYLRPALKRFHVYSCLHGSMEGHLERIVMGPSFDSFEFGKVPYNFRDCLVPHKAVTIYARFSFPGEELRPYPEDDRKGCFRSLLI